MKFRKGIYIMNNIIFPMKVHAVKLEYRRLKLEGMPHGKLKTMHEKISQ